jgi:hypothetical protein
LLPKNIEALSRGAEFAQKSMQKAALQQT